MHFKYTGNSNISVETKKFHITIFIFSKETNRTRVADQLYLFEIKISQIHRNQKRTSVGGDDAEVVV